MNKKKVSETRQKILEAYEQNEYANVLQNQNRARSFTVGTAFGGVIEVSMRGDHHNLWCLLQPVEAVEFIEQLAAAAGLQVALRPKNDFSTWRGWNIENGDRYWIGSAPWNVPQLSEQVNDTRVFPDVEEENNKMLKDVQEEHVKNNEDFSNQMVEEQKNNFNEYMEEKLERKKFEDELKSDVYNEVVFNKHQDLKDLRNDIKEYLDDDDVN